MNPLGTLGIGFIEFSTVNDLELIKLSKLFNQFGFIEIAQHKRIPAWLFKQNNAVFILSNSKNTHAKSFSDQHGNSVSSIAFRVKDKFNAIEYATKHGAKRYDHSYGQIITEDNTAIYGIGDSLIYFIEENQESYLEDFQYYTDWQGLIQDDPYNIVNIDHLILG